MIDIDHFKSINDTRGHLMGDEVIRHVAKIADQLTTDAEGVAARFGGEEFVALIADADEQSAFIVAESLRSAVEELTFENEQDPALQEKIVELPGDSKPFSVTVSVGIATDYPDQALNGTGLQLIDQADQALYMAKKSGRNQCYTYRLPARDEVPDSFAA